MAYSKLMGLFSRQIQFCFSLSNLINSLMTVRWFLNQPFTNKYFLMKLRIMTMVKMINA